MKTSYLVIVSLLCINAIANAQNNYNKELERIAFMDAALSSGGIAGLLDEVERQSWKAPVIPSRWHTENVSLTERKPIDIDARELGKKLAKLLDESASKIQKLTVGKELYEMTVRLLDLSEWCASTDGYGNLLLAQRSLDIGAVGVARLAVDLSFPEERIDSLLSRMNPTWMSAHTSQKILNNDAGAKIFESSDREEMTRTYGSGYRFLQEERNPSLLVQRQKNPQQWHLVKSEEIMSNLSFFDKVRIGQVRPVTLVRLWNDNWHLRIITGLELQSVRKAKALAAFRSAIGEFPEKPVFTEKQLRERERGAAAAAKAGLKVVSMEEIYASPQEAGFAQAWDNHLVETFGSRVDAPEEMQNLDSTAFQAYHEVQSGIFYDRDTANRKHYEATTQANP